MSMRALSFSFRERLTLSSANSTTISSTPSSLTLLNWRGRTLSSRMFKKILHLRKKSARALRCQMRGALEPIHNFTHQRQTIGIGKVRIGMKRSTPTRNPCTLTTDLLTWFETPPTDSPTLAFSASYSSLRLTGLQYICKISMNMPYKKWSLEPVAKGGIALKNNKIATKDKPNFKATVSSSQKQRPKLSKSLSFPTKSTAGDGGIKKSIDGVQAKTEANKHVQSNDGVRAEASVRHGSRVTNFEVNLKEAKLDTENSNQKTLTSNSSFKIF